MFTEAYNRRTKDIIKTSDPNLDLAISAHINNKTLSSTFYDNMYSEIIPFIFIWTLLLTECQLIAGESWELMWSLIYVMQFYKVPIIMFKYKH